METNSLAFWEFCDIAQCTTASPNISLGMIHKNFHKHPQRHALRAAWIVERAQRIANITLDVDAVRAASEQEEQDLQNAKSRTIASIRL